MSRSKSEALTDAITVPKAVASDTVTGVREAAENLGELSFRGSTCTTTKTDVIATPPSDTPTTMSNSFTASKSRLAPSNKNFDNLLMSSFF